MQAARATWLVILLTFGSLASAADVLRVGAGTITGTVARLNGFYEKWGLDIQRVPSTPSETMRGYLADGTVDIVDDGLDNAVASTLEGNDIVIIMGSSLSDQELIGQPALKGAADLRGKTVIVDALDTQYALLLKKMLLMQGLQFNVDYQAKAGITQRLPEMQAHPDYAAGIMGGTTALYAKRHGFVSLGSSSRMIGPLLVSGAYVRREWARNNADRLCRYIAANIQAQRWMMDKANKDQVIRILMTASEPKVDVDIATEVYAHMMQGPSALTRDAQFDVAAFKRLLQVRAEVQGLWGGTPPPPQTLFDLSYYRRALVLTRR